MADKQPMPVLDFVRTRATYGGEMRYNAPRIGFDMPVLTSEVPGVYFILLGTDILKVGKAEGKLGIKGRLLNYRSTNRSRLPFDRTCQLVHRIMTTDLKDQVLEVYYFEVPKTETLLEGYTVLTSMARSFEELLSRQARVEGHSMLLSGFD